MKKRLVIGILIISLLCVGLLGGCIIPCPYVEPFLYSLCNYSCSNSAFVNCINDLKTPKEICKYMTDNFTYRYTLFGKSPYNMWINEIGDCRDFSCFGRYVAQQHGYTAYEMYMRIYVPGEGQGSHVMGIYREGSSYSYSDVQRYGGSGFSSFQAIVNDQLSGTGITCSSWAVYDNCRRVIDHKGITATTKFINPGSYQYGTFIGAEPINRTSIATEGTTVINKGNPAQASGIVQTVAIWASYSMYDVEVATFYKVSEGRYSTRDTVYIRKIYAGSAREYVVNLDVQKGDLIGIYFNSGSIEKDYSGYSGLWLATGDHIPCANKSFSSQSGSCISLGGFVISP